MSGNLRSIHARTDALDRLVEADEPLAELQLRSGGTMPGPITAPALLELVRKSRLYGLRLARAIRMQDDEQQISAWATIVPAEDGEGGIVELLDWRSGPLPDADGVIAAERRGRIARQLAELSARLGPDQELLAVDAQTPELEPLVTRLRGALGRRWTDLITVEGSAPGSTLSWRQLDGASVKLDGSPRAWSAHLVPLGGGRAPAAGFELHLVPGESLEASAEEPGKTRDRGVSAAIGREIAPVLRQPISRIIANAETIRTQLAGPLAEEYSNYAADISTAGEHLLALIDDLADLEVVEDEQFTTAPDRIDLADVARRAVGILGVRAQEKGIGIDAPKRDEAIPATAEFRRVLQVLLNLLGNAIRYSPEGSVVWVRTERDAGVARIVVADQGAGLTTEQQARVFEKFERLGRSGDGGSGLGLYISRRLAEAMNGTLRVESAPGQGARFILELPADEGA